MPGWPPSASTARPESSENAGNDVAAAAASALMRALAANVEPGSSGSARPSSPAETASTPYGASRSRISRSLPGLWVAITSRPSIRRCMLVLLSHSSLRSGVGAGCGVSGYRQFLQIAEPTDSLFRQGHQREELLLGKRRLLGG